MPIETLEQELKNPRLQAALASAWWSEEEAELILSALERSGLTVREFAKRTHVGAARLYSRRQQLRKKNAQPKALDVAARRKESKPKEANPRAAQPPTELPPQFVQLTVQPTRAESECSPPAPIVAHSPSPLSVATPSPNARPLGLKVRFCRPARESPESVETLELELLFPTW
ncbi:MAG: hypothetical protein KA244_03780 [Deltaproteobacteria bacterium]|nr:hypothetical protein [Deltaproteobacteria bacterium]